MVNITDKSVFDCILDAKNAIINYSTLQNRHVKVVRSTTQKYHVKCTDLNCPFEVSCFKRKNGKVYVCRLVKEHECLSLLLGKTATVTTNYIANRLIGTINDDRNVRATTICNAVQREDGITVPYKTALRGKKKALEQTSNAVTDTFKQIGPYLEALVEAMPASTCQLEVDKEGRFLRCFVCLSACKSAFFSCLPILSFDACAIKNEYKGVLLAACSVDGSGELVPLAFALADIENNKNWSWFVNLLKHSIPTINDEEKPIIVLSDREKGIYNAAREQLPNNQHCYCVKHIEKNMKNRYKINFCEKLWKAAKTMSVSIFNNTMSEMEDLNEEAFKYLDAIEKESWTRAYSKLPRFGHVTSNVAECFNSWIGAERQETHFRLIVMIVRKIMDLFFVRRTFYSDMTSLVPRPLQKLFNSVKLQAGFLHCCPSSNHEFLVVLGCYEFTVDLDTRKCSCGDFQDYKLPCVHACAAIAQVRKPFMEYVDHYYKKPTLELVYEGVVRSVTISDLPFDNLHPPTMRPQAGRPKKLRMRNRSELQPEESPVHCSLCNEPGHNKRTCERRQRGERVGTR